MDSLSIASLVTIVLTAFIFGCIVGYENGIEEERRNHENRKDV